MLKIAPSILSANFANLGKEVIDVSKAGADYIHVDVMDGTFVPNITIGPDVVRAIRPFSEKVFDVHLMVQNPAYLIDDFVNAGANIITIHHESCVHLDRLIDSIKNFGVKVGVSIVPSTHESALDYIIEKLDLVLIMTVNPGFGGQKFLANQLRKIEKVREMIERKGLQTEIEVDGGISKETARLVSSAGASVLVSGNYIFSSNNYEEAILNLRTSA